MAKKGKNKGLFLTRESQIEFIAGPYRGQLARVLEVIGAPHQKRSVRVRLDSQEEVTVPQTDLKVIRNPYTWGPGSKVEFTRLPEGPPKFVARKQPVFAPSDVPFKGKVLVKGTGKPKARTKQSPRKR